MRLEIPKTLSHRHSPFHPNRRLFSLGTFLAPPQKEESPLLPPLLPWGFSEVILMAFGGGIDTSKREEEEEEIPLLQKKNQEEEEEMGKPFASGEEDWRATNIYDDNSMTILLKDKIDFWANFYA